MYSTGTNLNSGYLVSSRGKKSDVTKIVTKPIDTVENTVNTAVDVFLPEIENEEHKKSYKTAIRVGSAVLVLSGLVALFNPKFSAKMVESLKKKAVEAGNKSAAKGYIGQWNKAKGKFLNWTASGAMMINNANSTKDRIFTWFCNKVGFLKKPHTYITKTFDKISKNTVYKKYAKAEKNMNFMKEILDKYKNRLNPTEAELFEQKLKEISEIQKGFGKNEVEERLIQQEKMMSGLNAEVNKKIKNMKKILDKNTDKKEVFESTTSFWAQDALKKQKKQVIEQGNKTVESLIGGKKEKGLYNELAEILSPYLKDEEKAALDSSIKKLSKKIKGANDSECLSYFDKKRDLTVGSAPTDVMTAILSLGASGIALGTANSKEERVSRAVTGIIPIIGGVGTSIALTAKLISGGLSLALGSLSSIAMSITGSIINRFLPKSQNAQEIKSADNKTEAKNA